MSWGFAVLFGASCALVAFAASGLVAAGLPAADRVLGDVDARGRARLWLALALAPILGVGLVVIAAFGPWLGIAYDHCLEHLHEHAHLCFAHPAQAVPPLLVLPGAALGARVLTRVMRAGVVVARSRVVRRALSATVAERIGDAWVLPVAEPQAFVIGFARPRLFVTRGLLAGAGRDVLQAVIAHERAHARRRDPLRWLLATVALGFHLPGVAGALERRLGLAHEMAADEDAAGELGSTLCIAESLVEVARQSEREGSGGAGSAVSARVRELLCQRPRRQGIGVRALFAGATTIAVGVAVGASAVHHLLEHALELLGA